ncbi:glyoxalase [Streptomyces sp. MUM 2J]|uniref:glyoxalase n=1 Tax=Streptomyces sp. MUM 2J TaxID=2791987 RepID=UPI0035AC27FA|nr:glyoxalase [Streptomyces sp. MUM 2J]
MPGRTSGGAERPYAAGIRAEAAGRTTQSHTAPRLAEVTHHGRRGTHPAVGNPAARSSLLSEGPHRAGRPDPGIEAEDVDAAHAALWQRDAKTVHPLTDEGWGVRRFLVRALSGRVVNVLGHRGRPVGLSTRRRPAVHSSPCALLTGNRRSRTTSEERP